jgi:hypothetical protein
LSDGAILIVNDDPDIAKLFAAGLEHAGFKTRIFSFLRVTFVEIIGDRIVDSNGTAKTNIFGHLVTSNSLNCTHISDGGCNMSSLM